MTYMPGGGSGGGSIATSSDVALNNTATNDVLTYDSSVGKWKNAPAPASSVSSAVMVAKTTVQLAGNLAGWNWPNAGRVYIARWDQQSVTAADPAKAFRAAAAARTDIVRVFTWDDVTINAWKTNAAAAMSDLERMCTDAYANGVRLILAPRLGKLDIEALAGTTFATEAAAQQAVTTEGTVAHDTFRTLLRDTAKRVGMHPGVWSMEVVNEPNYMLGIDAGNVTRAAGIGFVDRLQKVLKDNGAVQVNTGGRAVYDMSSMTDEEIITFTRYADILDDHNYTDARNDDSMVTADAISRATTLATLLDRARTLTKRPALNAMMGEFGTLPWVNWHHALLKEGLRRGWIMLSWGYDSYDDQRFNEDTYRNEVLPYIGGRAPARPLAAPVAINTRTAAYTLVLSDAGGVVEMNVVSADTLTVPSGSSVSFPIGTIVRLRQYGAGQITIVPATGVTLRSLGGALKTAGQYAEVSLQKRAADEWVVSGDVVL